MKIPLAALDSVRDRALGSALIELVGDDTRKLLDRRYPDTGQPHPVDPDAPRVVAARESGVVTMIGTQALVREARRLRPRKRTSADFHVAHLVVDDALLP